MPKDLWLAAKNKARARFGIPLDIPSERQMRHLAKRNRRKKRLPCSHCGSMKIIPTKQVFADGSIHTRADCKDCGRFVKWL